MTIPKLPLYSKLSQKHLDFVSEHIRKPYWTDSITRELNGATGEIFTPQSFAKDLVEEAYEINPLGKDENALEPTCGNGNILGEMLIKLLKEGKGFKSALQSLKGIEIEPDTAELCRQRLLCGQTHLRHIVDKNIITGDYIEMFLK